MSSAVRYLVRKLSILCAILLIGTALVVQSGRSLFPLLESYQQELAGYISGELGLAVQWETLDAEWQGLKPSVRLNGLVIDDGDDRRLLEADQAYLRLNLLSSALRGRLAWDKVELRGSELSLSQGDDGYWGLPGVETPDQNEPIAPDDLLELFKLGTRVELLNSRIRLAFANEHEMDFLAPYLLLEHWNEFHRLSLQIDLPERDRALFAVVEGRGDPRDRARFRTEGYVQLRRFPTLEPLTALGGALLGEVADQEWYREGRMDASIWFASEPGGERFNLQGRLGLDEVTLPMDGLTLNRLDAEISGEWQRSGRWRLALQNLSAEWRDRDLEPLNLSLSALGAEAPIQLMVNRLDLEYWSLLSNQLGLLGKGVLQEVVQTMEPRGELHNVQISVPQNDWKNWQIMGELNGVAVEPWQGVPGLTGVSGFVEADARGGHLDLDSQDNFSMHFAQAFDQPMHYQQARGQVAWYLRPEDNMIYVNSGELALSAEGESARGSLWLSLPWERNSGDIDLYLDVHGENLDAAIYSKYLPTVVPDSLSEWLADSIGTDNPGRAQSGHFVFRGTLNTPEPMARSYQLALELSGAQLNYHPDWPRLSDLSGKLYLDDNQVDAHIETGRLYDSELTQAHIHVQEHPHGEGPLLSIQGQLDALGSDGLKLLRESYLNRFIGDSMDTWSLEGALGVNVDLIIPLKEEQPGARQQVAIDIEAAQLTMANLDLQLSDLDGQLNYSDETGLSAKRLEAVLFNEPLHLSIVSRETQSEAPVTRIEFTGQVDTERLAQWSGRPEVRFLDGKLRYDSRLELTHHLEPDEDLDQRVAALAVTSDLEGVALNLPEPYGKPREGARPLQLNVILGRQTALVDLRYDERLQALVQASLPTETDKDTDTATDSVGQIERINLALGVDASLPVNPGIHLSGRLEALNLERWQEVFAQYQRYQRESLGLSDVPEGSDEPDLNESLGEPESAGDLMAMSERLPLSADIDLGYHRLGPLGLEELSLDLTPTEDGWQLLFENPTLAGELEWYEDRPLQLTLDYLRLTGDLLADDVGQLLASEDTFDPRALPNTDVVVRELRWDGEDFGRWQFQLATDEQGLRLNDVQGEARGLTVTGLEGRGGAKLTWSYFSDDTELAVQNTRVQARLQAGDLSEVMSSWGQTDVIESQSADTRLDLSWSGAPQDFAVANVVGDINFNMQEGRFKRNPASGSDGILRLFAVLNFDSLARRMRLDFSDLYQSGLAYDSIEGRVSLDRGRIIFSDPIQVRSPSSRLQLGGEADLLNETLDARLVATLPVAGNLTFLTALAAGLPAAVGVYLVSKLFQKQVDQATSISYSIRGDWDDPQIKFDRMFEGDTRLRVREGDNRPESVEE